MKAEKTIVVVGASSGIGAAVTRALAADGHHLFICARRVERLKEVAASNPKIFFAPCDVTNEAEVAQFIGEVRNRTSSVDVLIYSAAILGPVGSLHKLKSSEWLTTLMINLFGAVLFTKQVVPLMMPERRPRILFVSGGGAFDPLPRLSAYGASKAGLIRLVESLAIDLAASNIAVNAVAPGFMATEIHQAVMDAGPESGGVEYDKAVKQLSIWDDTDMEIPVNCMRYMLSDAASKLTGKTISARFDPWGEPEFDASIDEILSSPLYATQRVNLVDLGNSPLAKKLLQAADNKRNRRGKILSQKSRTPPR